MKLPGKAKLQHWRDRMKEFAGSPKVHFAESIRKYWKPIAIILIIMATVLPSLAYAKPLNIDVSLSAGEIWSGSCCGSLVYRTSFYGWDKSKALASLLIITNSSWVPLNEIYLNLWHLPRLDHVTMRFRSSSTMLGQVTWKDGGVVPSWNSSIGEAPHVSVDQDGRTGVLSFQKVAHPNMGFALLLEFSSPDEIILTVEIGLNSAWAFGAQYYHGRVSLEVTPNRIGQGS